MLTCLVINLSNPKSLLLGKNAREYAEIVRWMSLSNSDFVTTAAAIIKPILGFVPYNKKLVEDSQVYLSKILSVYEKRLAEYTFLVGERMSIADIFAATSLSFGFKHLFGSEWRKAHPNVVRWFLTISRHSCLSSILGDIQFISKPIEYTPPKKEKKEKKEASTEASKKQLSPKESDEPEEFAEAPKAKHPLEALGKPKAVLDQWKRVYSNEDTRAKAIPWFWENQYDPEEWSLYKVDFKYNDELTLTFMSNNLIGGFFNRLSASTKFMFGCMVVYGENNNNGITGAFLVRGQDFVPAFDVAPDWESYAFKKLDVADPESKKFVENMWAWDEPVEVDGVKREIADGKVFK